MKVELAPSILSADMGNMRAVVKEMLDAGCERIHLDVMDGQFVPPITFGAKFAQDVFDERGFFEAHLMTQTPEAHFDAFIDAGCRGIMFHWEASQHPHRLLQTLKAKGVQAGIAINPGTPVSVLESVVDLADLVLVMSVNPGWGGQKFISNCLPKIDWLRSRRDDLDIEVDGGVDPKTIGQIRQAGANVFVAGSFLVSKPSIADRVAELRQACAD
jgi:ribulose-phosphate 3-epimerase